LKATPISYFLFEFPCNH